MADTTDTKPAAETAPAKPTHNVFTVVDREGGGRSYWTRVGSARVNRDGSMTVTLDALPVNGVLQVRLAE